MRSLRDGGEIYRLEDGGDSWAKLTDEDIYAPIIMTHCKPIGKSRPSEQELLDAGGVMFEGYNLLGNYCRRIWSTYNSAAASGDTVKSHFMQYGLLNNANEFVGKTVTAKITDKNGTVYTHSVTVAAASGWSVEQTSRGDGIYLAVVGKSLSFFTSPTAQSGGYNTATISESDYVEDNMVITEPCPNTKENLKKVFAMTRQMWFGGDAAGISGGSRVFLGANTDEKEKSLVIWSGLNNPLYFPENCYAYVGNNSQGVTAFGRQSDMLVIFKGARDISHAVCEEQQHKRFRLDKPKCCGLHRFERLFPDNTFAFGHRLRLPRQHRAVPQPPCMGVHRRKCLHALQRKSVQRTDDI